MTESFFICRHKNAEVLLISTRAKKKWFLYMTDNTDKYLNNKQTPPICVSLTHSMWCCIWMHFTVFILFCSYSQCIINWDECSQITCWTPFTLCALQLKWIKVKSKFKIPAVKQNKSIHYSLLEHGKLCTKVQKRKICYISQDMKWSYSVNILVKKAHQDSTASVDWKISGTSTLAL